MIIKEIEFGFEHIKQHEVTRILFYRQNGLVLMMNKIKIDKTTWVVTDQNGMKYNQRNVQ